MTPGNMSKYSIIDIDPRTRKGFIGNWLIIIQHPVKITCRIIVFLENILLMI